jgi:transcriptional regulator with XRE-family HTH domain
MGLRELRKAKGLTLHGLSRLSGVNPVKIQHIETGRIKTEHIMLRTAVKLARALGCTPDELLTERTES